MMPVTTSKWFYGAFSPLFLIALIIFTPVKADAQEARDLILVVDVSTSMLDLFDRVKAEARQFASSAQLGDRITIITFGKSSHLLERTRIRSSQDIVRILSRIESLEAKEYSTNLPGGIERGLQEMQRFYDENPEGDRIMMWLSDEKDNPPVDVPNLITFTSLRQREADRLPDRNWFMFEAPIEPEAESDVRWFVDWASRSTMRLNATLLTQELGTLLAPDLAKDVSVRFAPGTQSVRGSSFSIVAEVADMGGQPYTTTIPVTPSRIVCRGIPWEETFRLVFPDRDGDYTCRISFVLPSDKLLTIFPPQLSLRTKVQPEIRTAALEPASIDAKIDAALTAALEEARESVRREGFIFGPIAARGRYQVSTSLLPTRNVPLDSLRMEPSFKLPYGLELQPAFRISEGTLLADLKLIAGDELDLNHGWEMEGTISFTSGEDGVTIYPSQIPVKFYTSAALSQWGKRELPGIGVSEQFERILQAARSFAFHAARALLALLALWIVYRLVKRYGFATTDLVGRLEIIKNPTSRGMKGFNLRRMGKLRATNSLVIGSSRKADIVLPHPSVADMHVKIMTARTEAGVIVFVQPLHDNQVLVNDVVHTQRKEITDKDILAIGDFVILYRCPEIFRETIVRFADGRSMRGVLVSWDIDAPSFEFLPKGTPSLDARMVIAFSELKAIFFVRRASRFPGGNLIGGERRPAGQPVEVIFEDGELLEGYVIGEADEWSKRFYLIPRERSEIALVLVERSATRNIFMRGEFEKPPFDFRQVVRNVTSRLRL
jgi:hypothetical protein